MTVYFAQNGGVSLSLPLLRDQPLAALVSDSIKKRQGPEALANTLLTHGWIPDYLGELHNLTHRQARAINAAGYTAQAGKNGRVWRSPAFQHELVVGTALEHLSEAWSRSFGRGPGQWRTYRSHQRGAKYQAWEHARKSGFPERLTPKGTRSGSLLVQPLSKAQQYTYTYRAAVAPVDDR
jgi:hypothetical protein